MINETKRYGSIIRMSILLLFLMVASFAFANSKSVLSCQSAGLSSSVSDSLTTDNDTLSAEKDSMSYGHPLRTKFLEKDTAYRISYQTCYMSRNAKAKIFSDVDTLIINKVTNSVDVRPGDSLLVVNDVLDFTVAMSGVYDIDLYVDDNQIRDFTINEVSSVESEDDFKEPEDEFDEPEVESVEHGSAVSTKNSVVPTKKSVEPSGNSVLPVSKSVQPGGTVNKSIRPRGPSVVPKQPTLVAPQKAKEEHRQPSQQEASPGHTETEDTIAKAGEKSTEESKDSLFASHDNSVINSKEKSHSLWNINPLALLAIFLVLILAFLIYYFFRKLQKYADSNEVISSQNSQLCELNVKSRERDAQHTPGLVRVPRAKSSDSTSGETHISVRDRQVYILNTYVHELVPACEFINSSLKKLQQVIDDTQKNFTHRSAVVKLKNDLDGYRDILLDKDFVECFNQAYPKFETELTSRFSNLTSGDLHLCRYLALGMSTADIATLCNRETRTIDSSRNRLRKKLELAPGEDFSILFNSLLNN